MKYTILPPQEAPKQLTAHYSAKSLGDHFDAFMSANNIRGYMEELCVEEPIVEEVAAMWLIIVWEIQYQRQVEALRLYGIQQLADRRQARIKERTERISAMQTKPAVPVLKTKQVMQSLVRGVAADTDPSVFKTPLDEYRQSIKNGRMYDVADPVPLRDAEYRARLARILAAGELLFDKAKLSDKMASPPWRKHVVATREFYPMVAVSVEQGKAIAEAYQKYVNDMFVVSPETERFMEHLPKAEPNGATRINPYLK